MANNYPRVSGKKLKFVNLLKKVIFDEIKFQF